MAGGLSAGHLASIHIRGRTANEGESMTNERERAGLIRAVELLGARIDELWSDVDRPGKNPRYFDWHEEANACRNILLAALAELDIGTPVKVRTDGFPLLCMNGCGEPNAEGAGNFFCPRCFVKEPRSQWRAAQKTWAVERGLMDRKVCKYCSWQEPLTKRCVKCGRAPGTTET